MMAFDPYYHHKNVLVISLAFKNVLCQTVLLAFQMNWCFSPYFYLSTLPIINQSESSRQFSCKSGDIQPIRELSSPQVTIFDQSETSHHYKWRFLTNQKALNTNTQQMSVTKNTKCHIKIKQVWVNQIRKIEITILCANGITWTFLWW